MSQPTLGEIFDQARARIGDDQQGGGEDFVNNIFQPHFNQALRELFSALILNSVPFVFWERYFILPARQMVIDPSSQGWPGFKEPEILQWRPKATSVAITNVVISGTTATVTAPSHGLSDGAVVELEGIGGFGDKNSPNGMWVITVVDANTLSILGMTATGTYTSGGTITTGVGEFQDMFPRDRIEFVGNATAQNPEPVYAWQGGVLRFQPSTVDREIRILFRGSILPTMDVSAIIPIEDSLDLLAVRTAGLAASAHGAESLGSALSLEALGPLGMSNPGSGGLLRALVLSDIRNLQRETFRRPPFRPRRNTGSPILY